MSSGQPRLESSIKAYLAPVLRADGFSGSGRRFARVAGGLVHVIGVQGSLSGGKFAINLAIHPLGIPDVLGNALDPKRIAEPLCEFRRRLSEAGADQWWAHDPAQASMDTAVRAATEVYVRTGRALFDRVTLGAPLDALSPEQFAAGEYDLAGFGTTYARAAWVFAQLRFAAGRIEEARRFAEIGLAEANPGATSLRIALRSLAQAAGASAAADKGPGAQ